MSYYSPFNHFYTSITVYNWYHKTDNSYKNMINETEGVCVLENWNHDNSMNLEQQLLIKNQFDLVREQQLLLQDPYDSIWLKVIAILFYFINLLACAVMLAFINYENGHHGNFRSVINQLLSTLYAMVSLHFLTFQKYS